MDILDQHAKLRRFLAADPLDIENGLASTPMLQQEAGELAAYAIKVEDVHKNNVKVAEANAAARLREDLSMANGKGKEVPQNRIDSMLVKDEEVQQAKEALREASYQAHICKTLCDSLKSQSIVMNKVADLVVSGYFQPSIMQDRARAEQRRAYHEADQKQGAITRMRRPHVRPTE